jgi:hypothetical protein
MDAVQQLIPTVGIASACAAGKPGKPTTGFPPFPPPLEIAPRFPSHSSGDDCYFCEDKAKPDGRGASPLAMSYRVVVVDREK